jgi:hypothetical protein
MSFRSRASSVMIEIFVALAIWRSDRPRRSRAARSGRRNRRTLAVQPSAGEQPRPYVRSGSPAVRPPPRLTDQAARRALFEEQANRQRPALPRQSDRFGRRHAANRQNRTVTDQLIKASRDTEAFVPAGF